MKFAALLLTLIALAASGAAWSDTTGQTSATTGKVTSAQAWLAQRQALERQDSARYRVCDAQRVDNPATRSIDFTADGRRCLINALGQSASVQGALVLLRNASVDLRKNPAEQALRFAALRAVEQARTQLISERAWLPEHFAQQLAAVDLAEFSIHLPQQRYEQQVWLLEANRVGDTVARQD